MKIRLITSSLLVVSGGLAIPISGLHPTAPLLDLHEQSVGSESKALTATATILSQTYCHVDATSFSVLMDVRLQLTNVSDRPVILSKRIDRPEIVQVARSVGEGEIGQFESSPNFDRFVSKNPPNPPLGEAPSPEYFIVLGPRQSYDSKTSTAVFGTKEPTSRHGLVNRGAHVLRLGISTWPYYGYEDVEGLQKKWARFGVLQHGLIYTNFVPFRIPEKFKNPRCSTP